MTKPSYDPAYTIASPEQQQLFNAADDMRAALEPFAAFGEGRAFEILPDDFNITPGSALAGVQLTAGDIRKAIAAIAIAKAKAKGE